MSIGSRAIQQNTVSAGLALGLVELGRVKLPGDKIAFDFAFMSAWRRWQHKHQFTSVGDAADRAGRMLDPWVLATEYGKRTQRPVIPIYWGLGEHGTPEIYPARDIDDRDPSWEEYADDLVDSIPGRAWLELTREIVERVERPEVAPD